MLRKRHRPEEIVTKLRQVEVLTAQGRPVAEAIRSIGVTKVSSGTNCSTGRSSTRSRKPGSSSRAGDGITTPFDRTRPSATCHQLPRSWCGRLRFPGQLRRPHQPSPRGRQCTNGQPRPLKGGRPWMTHRHAGVSVVFRPRQSGEILESLAVIGGLLFYCASGPGSWSRASLRGG